VDVTLVCRSDKRKEVCKSKVQRRKFVPEKKEVPKVIISVMVFRNSPTDRDEGWIDRWGGGSPVQQAVPEISWQD
jgi:hypothetical protein